MKLHGVVQDTGKNSFAGLSSAQAVLIISYNNTVHEVGSVHKVIV